jgi:prefoldin subunit 5
MNIDERLEFLRRNIDSLHEAVFENTKHIAEFTRRADAHEREQQGFRRAMRAGLAAWLADNGDESAE